MADPDTVDTRSPAADRAMPEFRIVVRHPNRRGPLGPYRLLIAVAAAMIVLGPGLYSSLTSGAPDDSLLLRAGAIGLLVWITTGVVSTALGSASDRLDDTSSD